MYLFFTKGCPCSHTAGSFGWHKILSWIHLTAHALVCHWGFRCWIRLVAWSITYHFFKLMVELHNRVIVLGLHFFNRVFKLLFKLHCLHVAQTLLFVFLVIKFLCQGVTFNNLLWHDLFHSLCYFLLSHFHVPYLFMLLRSLNLITQVMCFSILLLLNELFEYPAVIKKLRAWLVDCAHRCLQRFTCFNKLFLV